MTTPKAIQDKIAEYEAMIAQKHEEIEAVGRSISALQERVLQECHQQDDIQNRLDLLRFVVEQYEAQTPLPTPGGGLVDMGRPIGTGYAEHAAPAEQVATEPFVGDIEIVGEAENWNEPSPEPTPQPEAPPPSIKDRVYTAAAWMRGPVKAADLAKELGMPDTRSVAPILGQLNKEKRIKEAPQGGGWIRTAALALTLGMSLAAGSASAQYAQTPGDAFYGTAPSASWVQPLGSAPSYGWANSYTIPQSTFQTPYNSGRCTVPAAGC